MEYYAGDWHYTDAGSLPNGPGSWPVAYAPVGPLLLDSTGKVFYRTRYGHVCLAYQAGGSWHHVVIDWNAPLAMSGLSLGPGGRLFYQGPDNRLHCLLYLP